MKTYFIFDFILEDEATEEEYEDGKIPIVGYALQLTTTGSDLQDILYGEDFDLSREKMEMEHECVHDWGACYFTHEEHADGIEYNTYELERKNIPALLEAWKEELISLGINFKGDWVKYKESNTLDE